MAYEWNCWLQARRGLELRVGMGVRHVGVADYRPVRHKSRYSDSLRLGCGSVGHQAALPLAAEEKEGSGRVPDERGT